MKQTAYGKPLLITGQNEISHLTKEDVIDEFTIQQLIFSYPECLPVSDIDEAYNPLIPICLELNTVVGPLDILMASPNGEIAIIETKLWRNPEARRKVVAQILDYARELSNWTYEDLQREVNRRLSKKGNTLYEIVKSNDPNSVLSESDFVDAVSRNLSRGKFLLLIAGDGIREGANGIAEFLSSAGYLNFTFAMVELTLYRAEGIGQLIIPKTIVKTTEISKMTIEIPNGFLISQDENFERIKPAPLQSPEKEKERTFYSKFWNELISELSFDDPGQPIPKPGTAQNLFVYPGKTKKAWISAYFMKSQKRVGVYFRVQNDQEGNEILSALKEDKDLIREELGTEVSLNWSESGEFGVRLYCEDVFSIENREEIKEFFKKWLNTFVNLLRPRIKKISF